MKLKPLSNNVFIEAVKAELTTKSGIVLPEDASGEKPRMGKIIATGPGKFKDGAIVPMSVKEGDMVLFKKYGPDEIEIDGVKYLVGDQDDILAVIEN
ncbi:MAG: co-chaperone GroES [Candidatus Harrisonbacteria bacterium CG10_big_fil_rev_8_21_14_0_10_38_8]|uniref:Co-chaperonin GroES n=1 Tax=Candidatus Harrisonbacteria bacterium CG10_big_fil_rev_8_21_14_0_10_38_8 TaxID=1974582 RepID=A0A2M6WJY4_9BACT|nr:MAG: co-chaperone GroES [Candidatus Harrisonbacteria bacterium CG10_big_fil_rev_8_21_14_0_10_38_8]